MNDKDATIEITRNDKKEVIPVADLEAFDLKGKPVVTVSTYVTAKEMSDPIGISVISGDGHKLPLKDTAGNKSRNGAYSISVYTLTLQMSNNASVSKDLKKLYTTLGNYGVYAQLYFKHNDEKVKILDDLSDVKTSVFDSYKAKTSGSLSGVKFVGGNLILDADTTLMTYFYSKKDLSKYTFQIDGRTVTPEKDGDYYILTLDGIEAKNLDKTYAFSVSDGKNKLTANYSALSYAQSTIAGKNESLINLMKAMYKYNAAANVYFKS
jgi:hypothetical protein